ncbi:MAG: energy transducer TonB [Opitutaceae bacterium]
MKLIPLLIFSLLLAACASSPKALRKVSFSGDYIDTRKDITVKAVPTYRAPLRVPAYVRARNWNDSVVVAFMVEADGRTSEVQIVSTDDDELAEAVRESVSVWRYAPPMKNGKPVRVVVQETVGWRPQFPLEP